MKKISVILTLCLISLTLPFFRHLSAEFTVSVNAAESAPRDHAIQVLEQLNDYFPEEDLPTRILTAETPTFLSAATTDTSDSENFTILYYAESDPYPVNDKSLNNLTPIASFHRVVYPDQELAQKAVKQIIDQKGEVVDLGNGIEGYLSAGMGSSYLSWQEGNWSFNIHSYNQDGKSPMPLAQEIVAYLEEIALPAPEVVGQINLRNMDNVAYNDNSAAWQEGNVVYIVTHFDPMTLIQMTGSITNPTQQ